MDSLEYSDARYRQTNAPTSEPVLLDDVKSHCSIIDGAWDEYLNGLIAKSRRTIEQRLNRQIMPATYVLSLDCFPCEIVLERVPVTAVTSISYIDANGTTRTLASAEYQVDTSCPDRPARIKPVLGIPWPSTQADTYNAVTVTFTAGYANAAVVPPTLKHAVCMLAAQWFKLREPVTNEIVNVVPMGLDMLLDAENPGVYA